MEPDEHSSFSRKLRPSIAGSVLKVVVLLPLVGVLVIVTPLLLFAVGIGLSQAWYFVCGIGLLVLLLHVLERAVSRRFPASWMRRPLALAANHPSLWLGIASSIWIAWIWWTSANAVPRGTAIRPGIVALATMTLAGIALVSGLALAAIAYKRTCSRPLLNADVAASFLPFVVDRVVLWLVVELFDLTLKP